MAATKQKMVTGVFRDRLDSQEVFEWLRNRGYTTPEINVLMSESTREAYLADQNAGKISAGSAAAGGVGVGGAIGTAVGATVAAILAIGSSVLLPGLGWVAGPLAAAFAGGGAGAVTGGIIGGLVGMGIPEPNAHAYQEALREGGVIIGVVPHTQDEVQEIKSVFESYHADNVCYC